MATEPSPTETIYIPLRNEGTDCWRPTEGRMVADMTFEVLPTPDYDPDNEEWEFVPSSIVVCESRALSSGVVLATDHHAPVPPDDRSNALTVEIAQRSGISVTKRGGLRLVAAEDVDPFLAACASERIRVLGFECFEYIDGNVVRCEIAGPLSGEEWATRARMVPRRAAGNGIWIDFCLEHPSHPLSHHAHPPMHMPPVPVCNPRIRLREPNDVDALRLRLAPRGFESVVCLGEIVPTQPIVEPRVALRDLAALFRGERLPKWARCVPAESLWRPVESRSKALSLLTHFVSHDAAYRGRVMEEDAALEIAETFLGLFGTDGAFFTNGEVGRDGFYDSWTPLTEATFDAGIGASDGMRVGMLIVTCED